MEHAHHDAFARQRPRLTRIAYRMLGSMAEAEDVVQDAWLRWQAVSPDAVREPAGFLVRTVTRLCLDVLKSARVRRECYIGPWLPEPVLDPTAAAEDVVPALMIALERLSPLERAAFLLHDVFGHSFEEIALALDREAAACRQLASRARGRIRAGQKRFRVDEAEAARVAEAFFHASRSGDAHALATLLTEHAVALTDGGGKVRAALRPIIGRDKVTRLFCGLARKRGFSFPPVLWRGRIDGLPGFITLEAGGLLQTTALLISDAGIAEILIVRNPDKLGHLASLFAHS